MYVSVDTAWEELKESMLALLRLMTRKAVLLNLAIMKVSKDAQIRNRYNQVPHLTQDTNGKVTKSYMLS